MQTTKGTIEKWQIKCIHTYGNELGIVDQSAQSEGIMDELHLLINCLTGKCSSKELTYSEANVVLSRLKDMMKVGNRPLKYRTAAVPEKEPERTGMASAGQIKKIWRLMYTLQSYDKPGGQAGNLKKRLKAILRASAKVDDLKFLTRSRANTAIEAIKGIIETERKKAAEESCQ